jgi:3-methyl-2-oxobutanoate hydroxymethyltransferase
VPKFVKKYGDLRTHIRGAIEAYADEVRERSFPSADYVYVMRKAAE